MRRHGVKSGGIRILTLFGVRVTVHPSWLLIFGLLVFWLATVGGPSAATGLSDVGRWILAPIVAVLFFISVLAHELAHAYVARARGVPVDEVMLFIFGGAARLDREAPTPRSEVAITIAGPATSVILGVALVVAGVMVSGIPGQPAGVAAEVLIGLGIINVLLAAFNLIPGFPMDGGRLLRAIIWARTRDFLRATRLATLVGRGFAYLLIAVGLVVALGGGDGIVFGVWAALIGWFLHQASEQSYRRVELAHIVEGVAVGDVMDREFSVVSPGLTLDTFVDQHLLGSTGTTIYPVMVGSTLMGTIELRQVRRVPRSEWQTKRVSEVMSRQEALWTLTEPQPAMDAVGHFEASDAQGIAVVDTEDRQRLTGVVTREGLVRVLRQRRDASRAAT
ncbi:MAG: site-2 protease family protein [Chloroflexota bacterium]|nr:site-2 protease family protein [Chloroflexota bacterium]